jgi:exopolysaccharide biosynthesis polyprenyl glycosylphosphotransferase
VTPSENLSGETIRQLAWRLEGRSVDLLIAPAMMDIAGPRLSVRPAAGLPLLHLDEAVLSRSQRVSKRLLDLVGSIALIVVLSPVMVACAISVKVSSKGPVIFRQVRIGRGGQPFTMLKFRTMVLNADQLKDDLRAKHELDDPMFKLTDDPRITGSGKFLRRWSLDELPQLFNALGGSMSLVGPRPHPLDDVDRYELEAYRRLALKPGLTGLWQVEGRSDLDWAEALQLDLYYVETWSLSGDVVLLARTVRAVVQGRGAV